MAFDVAAARAAGYSDQEIAEYLGSQNKFDTDAALKAGYTPEEIIGHLGGGKPPKESGILSELRRGIEQPISSAITGVKSIFGTPEEEAIKGVQRGREISERAGEGPSLEAVKKAYERGLLPAAGEVLSQIPKALAGQAGTIGSAMAGARLGAMAGAPFGPVGAVIGGVGGAGAALLPQFLGSNIERQAAESMEKQQPVNIRMGEAAKAAAGQAALEGAGQAFMLGKGLVKGVLGLTDDVALMTAKAEQELLKKAQQSVAGAATRGAAIGATEIPVEVGQQILERWQAGLPLTNADAMKEYGESAYLAGLIGGTVGGASRVMERGAAQDKLAQRPPTEQPAPEAPPAEPPLQLGMSQPFTPVVFPDGTVARSPEDIRAYEEEQFRKKYEPQPVQEPQQMDLFGQEDLKLRGEPAPAAPAPKTAANVQEAVDMLAAQERADQRQAEAGRKELEAAGQQRLGLRRTPEGEPTATGRPEPTITAEDIMLTAIPLGKGVQKWVENNVWGRTRSQLQDLVTRQPDLAKGPSPRARLLRVLTAPEVPAFEETRREPTPTPQPAAEPTTGLGRDQQGLEVPSEPARPGDVGGVPATPGRPARPVRRRLAPIEQPADEGRAPQVPERGALNEPSPAVVPTAEVAPVVPEAAPEAAAPVKVEQPAPARAVETVTPPKAPPKPGVVTRLEAARTREAFEKAMDELVAIQRSEAHPDKDTVGEFIGSNLRFKEFEAALRAAEQRNRAPQKAPEAPTAYEPEEKAPKKKFTPVKPPAFYQPVGINRKTGKVIRGPQMMLQPMDDAKAKKYLEDTARADEGTGEDAMSFFDELDQEIEAEAAYPELDFNAEPQVAEEAPAPVEPPKKAPEAPAIAEWAKKYNEPGNTVVYADDDVALIRVINILGNQFYQGMLKDGRYARPDIEYYTGDLFTDEQKDRLLKARADAVFAESKRAAKYPDGPFTGATSNVVKSDSVDQRYADLLRDLMQSMGLGNVRIFLLHPEDMRGPEAQAKYKLYKAYETAQTAGFSAGEEGSAQPMGPDKRDFYISFKPGMSENKSIEVITHELGHVIELVAFKNAPQDVQDAIKKEHEAWLASTKGKTGRELVQMLRNRETADTQMMSVPEDKTAEQMREYWKSFGEWFADNVSRWASTADKPVTITEKFFSRVAQMMRDLVALVTGKKYPPNKKVAEFLDAMGPGSADLWLTKYVPVGATAQKAQFSVSYSTEQLIDSMGALEPKQRTGLRAIITGFQDQKDPSLGVKFRTQVADIAASIERRLHEKFNGAVRDSLGNLNPMGLYRQAQDYTKMLLEYFQQGSLVKDKSTGLWKVTTAGDVNAPSRVYDLLDAWGKKNGYSFDRATQIASRILEGVRLNEMRESNRTQGTEFLLHLTDAQIDQLVAEYRADPDLKALSDAMDAPRKALVDKMVEAGRLSPEMGKQWKDVIGYVPFDRIDDFESKFSKVKKVSGRGIAQLGKLPELVGSKERPVGNVFDNYLNTLGWMVGQTLKNDASVQTLRALEDLGQAKFLGNTPQFKDNTASAYVNGEQKFWELPSKYDVMAFKDLTPPKSGYLKLLGQASNILRTTVTALPPFALKQVVDDIQRAILTSGVKSPTAIVWRSLTNFPKLALAELRGIRHPIVKDAEAMGFSGAFDFVQGRPAASLLADMGYKPRGWIKEALHRLEGITRASDLAVRKAIYDQTVKEGGDALLAQTRAREFINFRRRGASDFVGAMVTTIPFFNAYVQGMDVLYRAASGIDSSSSVTRAQARKLFWNRAAAVTAMSMLYALGKDDDDEQYNEADLRTRDSNWFIGGQKLSVPGELGAIFKVIPERIVEYYKRQGTPEEQDAFEAMRTALTYMYEQYVGRTVPIPQAAKPLLEAWTNYSFLTGRPLEGIHQKAMLPSQRRTETTSELALAISKFSKDQIGVEVSPIMIDNTLRGYFGSTAAMTTMVTDSLLNPTRVDRPLHKWALLSNYMIDPVGTRRLGEFYEEREKVGQLNTTLNDLAKTDIAAAEAFAEKHAGALAMNTYINATLEQLEQTRAYRKYLNSPDGAAEMSKAEREREIEEIRRTEVEYVRWLREAKAMMRNEYR